INKAKVGLVHQRGGLQGLSRLLLGQLRRRELAQLVVDQRQELLRGGRVALLDGRQDAGDFAHAADCTSAGSQTRPKTAHPRHPAPGRFPPPGKGPPPAPPASWPATRLSTTPTPPATTPSSSGPPAAPPPRTTWASQPTLSRFETASSIPFFKRLPG